MGIANIYRMTEEERNKALGIDIGIEPEEEENYEINEKPKKK